MEYTFIFFGKLDRNINLADIENLLKVQIANQQKQFETGQGDDDPNNISIVDYAYSEAEPNCYMTFSKWRIQKQSNPNT